MGRLRQVRKVVEGILRTQRDEKWIQLKGRGTASGSSLRNTGGKRKVHKDRKWKEKRAKQHARQ